MRRIIFLLGMALVVTSGAVAQTNSATPLLLTTSTLAPTFGGPSVSLPNPLLPAPGSISSTGLAPSPTPDPQVGVQAIYENYAWQAYFGYTFFRFFEVPHVTPTVNGFNYSMAYYFKDWIGADGEMMATWGGQCKHFLYGAAGPRFRWSLPRGLEIWGHALLGTADFLTQTANGGQTAFAYTLGGGLDVNAHHQRFAYRIQVDALGSRFFDTYQFSPKVSAGIVFKF
jgi:hypothetical protein